MTLISENTYKGFYPNEILSWPLSIIGGTAPYALNIDWGDEQNTVISRPAAGKFNLTHTYQKQGPTKGAYPVRIKASDADGQSAYLQLAIIVNDPALSGVTQTQSGNPALFAMLQFFIHRLLLGWTIYLILLLMLISFWLGERREKGYLPRRLQPQRSRQHAR